MKDCLSIHFSYLKALLGLLFLSISFSSFAQSKPNVLFITVDDMNGWGIKKQYPLTQIPYFDKLKSQSYNFVKNICASPVCTPSRAAFFSGKYPHNTGAYYNGGNFYGKNSILDTLELIPECFKRNGYETFGRGKIFHAEINKTREEAMFDNRPIYQGGFGPFAKEKYWIGGKGHFESVKAWDGPDSDFPDVKNAEAAIDFLNQKHENPFFCYVGLWRPHTPFTAPKRFFDLFREEEIIMPKGYLEGDLSDVPLQGRELVDSLWRFGGRENLINAHAVFKKMIHGYLATTAFADWSVGRIIEALDSSMFVNNTIVVVASDNGYHMGEKERWQKGTLWEFSAYSPFLIRLPNGNAFECPQTTNLIDIYPTLVELCKLNPPRHVLDGTSLVPILTNTSLKWKPSLMTYGENYSSLSDGRYRYIRYPDRSEELYDHEVDPFEWNNISKNKKLKKIKRSLSEQIPKKWAKSLGGKTEKKSGY